MADDDLDVGFIRDFVKKEATREREKERQRAKAKRRADADPDNRPIPKRGAGNRRAEPPQEENWDQAHAEEVAQREPPASERMIRFKLVSLDDLKLDKSGNYLVKGLVPREGLVVIWGPPKCGKSFVTMDMLLRVALGWQYRGHRVRQGLVVYCALEGQSGYPARMEAFYAHQGEAAAEEARASFKLMFTPLDLIKDHNTLIGDIKAQLPPGVTPAAIAIDTLNRSLMGSESDDKDMSAYVQAADALRDFFKCAVIIVHHCGINGTRPRGHTSLAGADDTQIAVKRDDDKNIIMTVEHSKDGLEGEIITSKLEVVDLGPDNDGDPMTSCVVVPVEVEPEPAAASTPGPKLSTKQNLALDALLHLLEYESKPCPFATKAVTENQWKIELMARSVIGPESTNPQARYTEIKDKLCDKKCIVIRNSFVWIP
jgi:hypothetical protein